MPIRPENKHFYGKDWKTRIRPEILTRAKHKCEMCGVDNHTYIYRSKDDPARWSTAQDMYSSTVAIEAHELAIDEKITIQQAYRKLGFIYVVLTIAHLNHNPADNRPENLRALCQKCHNGYDAKQRALTRKRIRQGRNINQNKLF